MDRVVVPWVDRVVEPWVDRVVEPWVDRVVVPWVDRVVVPWLLWEALWLLPLITLPFRRIVVPEFWLPGLPLPLEPGFVCWTPWLPFLGGVWVPFPVGGVCPAGGAVTPSRPRRSWLPVWFR